MEHVDMKFSLDSKLQIYSICSIRIPPRKWSIFQKLETNLFTTKSNSISGSVGWWHLNRDATLSKNILDILALIANDETVLLAIDIDGNRLNGLGLDTRFNILR